MRKIWMGLLAVASLAAADVASASEPLIVDVNAAVQFATLPDGVRYPEGIAANPATGDIFVATFDFGPNANKLMRFAKNGHLSAIRDFGPTPMLGLGFGPVDGKVYILNMGVGKVQRIAAGFDGNSPIEDVANVPNILSPGPRSVPNPDGTNDVISFGSNGFAAPNGMVFDRSGNLYFSDSFQGAVFKVASVATCAKPCPVTTVAHDPLLATAGFPPFGANGIALNADESAMFIANTGDNRVLRMDMASKVIAVFAESVHGADGVVFDSVGRLWVCANQADQVVALSETGRVIARLGSFLGIRKDGTPDGLLFPASPVIVDGWMYVTNLALPLTGGDEPERDVTRWTVSRMKVPNR